MNKKNTILTLIIVLLLMSCTHKTWTITQRNSVKLPIDAKTEAVADRNYEAYLQPLKQKVDAQMNEVIGQSAVSMRGHAPESLLSNLTSDVYRKAASDFKGSPVDIAIVNLGGLRTEVPAGNITVGKVFELMPFENELVILWLKGDKLLELLQSFAAVKGQGVSGLRMGIRDGKAVDITIGGNPIDINKIYSIATNDYLAGGNDRMLQLAQYEKRENTGVKVRNILMNYIKNETANGRKIQSQLDGRISIY